MSKRYSNRPDSYYQLELKCKKILPISFPCISENVVVIEEPTNFFNKVKESILKSQNRIIISTLYFGVEEKCAILKDAIEKQLEANSKLEVIFLMDYLRGTRNVNYKENNTSSLLFLKSLKERFGDRVQLHFYHTPLLSGIAKKIIPERMNEVIGVYHMKAYIFDDDVLMSGANFSEQYFTDRQDRYVLFKDHKFLSDFYLDAVKTIISFSYSFNSGELLLAKDCPVPYENSATFCQFAGQKMKEFHDMWVEKSNKLRDDLKLEADGNPLMKHYPVTWIHPTFQNFPIGVIEDSTLTEFIFENVPKETVLNLSSPYFNLNDAYSSLMLAVKSQEVNIVVASPQANGFMDASGLSKHIPALYDLSLQNFFSASQNNERIKLFEYQRDNWTFHAKGLWIFFPLPEEVKNIEEVKKNVKEEFLETNHIMTLIGSSNFSHRSVYRDLESQLFLCTSDPILATRFKKERDHIFESTTKVSSESVQSRSTPFFLRILSRFASNYM